VSILFLGAEHVGAWRQALKYVLFLLAYESAALIFAHVVPPVLLKANTRGILPPRSRKGGSNRNATLHSRRIGEGNDCE
jgi:hypothetical protein